MSTYGGHKRRRDFFFPGIESASVVYNARNSIADETIDSLAQDSINSIQQLTATNARRKTRYEIPKLATTDPASIERKLNKLVISVDPKEPYFTKYDVKPGSKGHSF